MITITDAEHDGHVEDYTLSDFMQEVTEACKTLWEDDCKDLIEVRIPGGLFPGLMEVINPITRSIVKIERVDMVKLSSYAMSVYG